MRWFSMALRAALAVVLVMALSTSTFAQGGCRGSGGPRPSMTGPMGEGASAFRIPLASPIESARQYMLQLQQQELARNYLVQLRQVQEESSHQSRRAAEAAEEKRQEKVASIQERRAAELARRESAKQRRKTANTEPRHAALQR